MPGEVAEFRQRLLPDTPLVPNTPIKGIIRVERALFLSGLELGLTVK